MSGAPSIVAKRSFIKSRQTRHLPQGDVASIRRSECKRAAFDACPLRHQSRRAHGIDAGLPNSEDMIAELKGRMRHLDLSVVLVKKLHPSKTLAILYDSVTHQAFFGGRKQPIGPNGIDCDRENHRNGNPRPKTKRYGK